MTDRTVTVMGTGTVTAAPTLMRLSMGVAATRSEVASALAAANEAAAAVYQSLRDAGLDDGDVRTTSVQIEVEYDYDGGKPPRPSGYQASQHLVAVVRDVTRAGDVIGAAAAAGGDATRIGGIDFDVADSSEIVTAARDLAFADARKKAEQYARAANAQLGDVIAVAERADGAVPMELLSASQARYGAPLQPGSRDITAHVSVTWALV